VDQVLLEEALSAPILAALLELADEEEREADLAQRETNQHKPASYLFRDRHYATVFKELNGGNGSKLVEHMRKVIASDRILSKLEVTNPGEQIYFGNDGDDPNGDRSSDRWPVYELSGQTPEAIKVTIKECPVINPTWILTNKPFNWMIPLTMKWAAEKRNEGDQRTILLFFVVHIYASLTYKYWQRKGGYQPNAMSYAVNSLSDKFILKQSGNMLNALMSVAWRSHEKYLPNLKSGDDYLLIQYYINLWTRLNGLIKSFWIHYMDVLSKGLYLNQSKDHHDDGEAVERDPASGKAGEFADKATEAFVSEPTDQRLLGLAAQMSDAPRQSLMLALNEIRAQEGELIREHNRTLLELFFEEKRARPEDVRTRGFIAFCVAVYMRSNTKDGRVEAIKRILDELLAKHSVAYLRSNREATKGVLRKGLYLYFCLQIQSRA
jgi:hypothetical protein